MAEFSKIESSIGPPLVLSVKAISLCAWNTDNPFRNQWYCKEARHVNQENGENKENYPQEVPTGKIPE